MGGFGDFVGLTRGHPVQEQNTTTRTIIIGWETRKPAWNSTFTIKSGRYSVLDTIFKDIPIQPQPAQGLPNLDFLNKFF